MQHVFIINPTAGKKDSTKPIIKNIYSYFKEGECTIHITEHPKDAEEFSRNFCENNLNEKIRFYSCGGDGTLNEIVNGIYGFENVSVASYPSGSGNDFIKYYGKKDDYTNIANLVNGREVEIDLIKFNGRLGVNVFNLGFDANVVVSMQKYKRLPLIGGKGAYIMGVFTNFFRKLTTDLEVYVEDEVIFSGPAVLSAIANSICYGGGFYCAPRALVDDGILDVLVVKKISRFKFIKLIGSYKKGTHLDNPKLKNILIYKQGKNIRIKTKKPVNYSYDGELGRTDDIEITVLPKAVKFVVVDAKDWQLCLFKL